MNRFSYTGTTEKRLPRLLWLVLPLIFIIAFVFAVRSFGSYSQEKQAESLENALRRDIIQCYAIEGIYPPSLEYLEEHYGLVYDETRFYIDYKAGGGNMYPDVTVLELRGSR